MEMLRKISDCESLENFPKNVYDGVCFNKLASLYCANCNCTTTRIHHRFFFRICSKELYSGFHHKSFPRGFWKIALYKISEKFLPDNFVISYLTKLQTSCLYVATLLKRKCWQKHVELTFNFRRGYYYYLKDNIYI